MLKTYSLVDWCLDRTGSLEEIATLWRLEVVIFVLGAGETRQDPRRLQFYCLLQLIFLLSESLHSEYLRVQKAQLTKTCSSLCLAYRKVLRFHAETWPLSELPRSYQQLRQLGSFLVWVPPEADLVIRIQVQVLSIGGDLSGEWRSETGNGGQPLLYYWIIKHILTMYSWNSVLL